MSARINPVLFLHKLPFAKRYFEGREYDPTKTYLEGMTNPNYGIASMFAGGLMIGFLFLIFSGLLSFSFGIFKVNIDIKYPAIISGVISLLFCYLYLWNKEQDIKEFKKFDKMPRAKKVFLILISLISIVLVIFAWFQGITFWGNSIENL
jgi:magnesium-transporting ATPase (P-type)